MRILQTANLHYHPANSGVTKINRRVLERLVELGHRAMTVVPALPVPSPLTRRELLADLASHGIEVQRGDGADTYRLAGVEVVAVEDRRQFRSILADRLRAFVPDAILVSSEDPSQSLLSTALDNCPGRVVYVANTTSMLPFGPHAFFPSARRTEMLRRARAIVSVSEFMTSYLREHADLSATTLYPPIYDVGPFPSVERFDSAFVTMINPSQIKGISIFVALAERMPETQFAAVPSWATTGDDLETLSRVPNVTVMARTVPIDEVYANTRVLVVPSLWAEALSMVPVEAMLRGIPVLASDVGGLRESKGGTDYLLPVVPVTGYQGSLDGNFVPIPNVSAQDVTPWLSSLRELLGDRRIYERQAGAARAAGAAYLAKARVEVLEEFLRGLF